MSQAFVESADGLARKPSVYDGFEDGILDLGFFSKRHGAMSSTTYAPKCHMWGNSWSNSTWGLDLQPTTRSGHSQFRSWEGGRGFFHP